jgi:hypothetical protein
MADLPLPPLWLQNLGYDARIDRRLIENTFGGEGVLNPGGLKSSADGTSMYIAVTTGEAIVRGDSHTDDALYMINSTLAQSLLVTSDGSNPKIAQVVARIYDNDEAGGVYDKATIEIVDGTATSGATLDNRTGAAALPSSALLLADVLIDAGATTIAAANVRDRRSYVGKGLIPNILTNPTVGAVAFEGGSGMSPSYTASSITHASHDTKQVAMLMYLPKRIASATKVKFTLRHSGTALTGTFTICDASGRPIATSASAAISGSFSTSAVQTGTITATTFDAGHYYVFLGLDTTAGAADCFGFHPYAAHIPNLGYYATSGGVTVPTTILGLTDITAATPAVATALPVLPVISIHVS